MQSEPESAESATPASAGACTSPEPSGAGVHALIPTKASAARRRKLSERTDREHVAAELERLRLAIEHEIENAEVRLDGALRASGHVLGIWSEPARMPPATLWYLALPLIELRDVGALFDFLIEAAS